MVLKAERLHGVQHEPQHPSLVENLGRRKTAAVVRLAGPQYANEAVGNLRQFGAPLLNIIPTNNIVSYKSLPAALSTNSSIVD